MKKNEARAKSVRKPLRELSNNNNYNRGGGTLAKSENLKKKAIVSEKERGSNESLDRLLLVQSDLSCLLRQIDEFVAGAFKLNATGKEGRKEIESFTHVLSEMLSTLKPWVPRFQKVLSSPPVVSENKSGQCLARETFSLENENENECFEVRSSEETKFESLISPSPLVSWRADRNFEGDRQLFLLTPLPMPKALSSKRQDSAESAFQSVTSNIGRDENDVLLEGAVGKPTPSKPSDSVVAETGNTIKSGFVSSPVFCKGDRSILFMTPCLKMSPPKSCLLLEPSFEPSHRGYGIVHKSTPFPVGIRDCSDFSESSSSEVSEDLTLKYPALIRIQEAYKPQKGKKDLEASPKWLFSPLKSCVLLDPHDEKSVHNVASDQNLPIPPPLDCPTNLPSSKLNHIKDSLHETMKLMNDQEDISKNLVVVESTPMWKEPESRILSGKRPGESTLKKELWTKFEAASNFGLRLNGSAVQRTARKGFLDMLDEVSGDEECPVSDGLS